MTIRTAEDIRAGVEADATMLRALRAVAAVAPQNSWVGTDVLRNAV